MLFTECYYKLTWFVFNKYLNSTVYRNIKLKHKLLLEVPVDTAVEADMKARIQELEEDMANVWEDLQMALEEEVCIYSIPSTM